MTKTQLIEFIARRAAHLPQRELEAAINAVFDLMGEALTKEERIEIRGFGCFAVRTRHARPGRNPKTGAKVQVPERKMLTFTVGKELKARIEAAEQQQQQAPVAPPTALPVSAVESFPVARTGSDR